jgi:DNA/RNA endonuclease YhcR with UshA esterase domain
MKGRLKFLGPLILALGVSVVPLHAQTSAAKAKTVAHPWYDVSREVTLAGTVTSVVKTTTPEMKMLGGAHLIVQTKSGAIDASLGGFVMRGKGALSINEGERVQVTGVVKIVNGKEVLLTRLVQANGHQYVLRNEHGFLIGHAAHSGTAKPEAEGGQL